MKKQLIILSLGLLTLASCSKDSDDSISIQAEPEDNSPVLIRLGSGNGFSVTRSSIESDQYNRFQTDSLGIFMLAMHKQNVNPEEVDVTWDPAMAKWEASWLDNVLARADSVPGQNTNVDIVFLKEDGVTPTSYWYPMDNWYGYRFFAYYPYKDDLKEQTADKRTVFYDNLDGTVDIIWGQTVYNPADKAAYSARYFRKKENKDKFPVLPFEHKLMRLQFYLVGMPDSTKYDNEKTALENQELMYADANTVSLDTVFVQNVPTTAELVIADKNQTTSGNLTVFWDGVNAVLKDLFVRGSDDAEFESKAVNYGDTITVGQPILLPVLDDDAFAIHGVYQLGMKFSSTMQPGHTFTVQQIDLNLKADASYKAGKTYNVYIKVSGPQKIQLKATLEGYVVDGDADVELN